jgi:hypothetical protein
MLPFAEKRVETTTNSTGTAKTGEQVRRFSLFASGPRKHTGMAPTPHGLGIG